MKTITAMVYPLNCYHCQNPLSWDTRLTPIGWVSRTECCSHEYLCRDDGIRFEPNQPAYRNGPRLGIFLCIFCFAAAIILPSLAVVGADDGYGFHE